MFLIGGPAFSGTTLLTLLVDQGDVVCLDEPDFHKPEQSHRGIPALARRFPDRRFPPRAERRLTLPESMDLIRECETAIHPAELGFKTCNQTFLDYAALFAERGLPVVAIVRDIRDALATPLPGSLDEAGLNERYRAIWAARESFDRWVRYEDLVARPSETLAAVSAALGLALALRETWAPETVPMAMFKASRHELLRAGHISTRRVGLWRTSARALSPQSIETAQMMGYAD